MSMFKKSVAFSPVKKVVKTDTAKECCDLPAVTYVPTTEDREKHFESTYPQHFKEVEDNVSSILNSRSGWRSSDLSRCVCARVYVTQLGVTNRYDLLFQSTSSKVAYRKHMSYETYKKHWERACADSTTFTVFKEKIEKENYLVRVYYGCNNSKPIGSEDDYPDVESYLERRYAAY